MIVIGLTGPSGAGKGYVSEIWQRMGIPTLDTDAVAHDQYRPGQPCLQELTAEFGTDILNPDGTLNRKRLAEIVFSDPEALARLNRITHAFIRKETEAWLDRQAESGQEMAVVDAPVLFESGFDKLCDCTVGVLAGKDVRIDRIVKRDGITREQAEARIRAQHEDAFFETNCTFVIRNERNRDPSGEAVAVIGEIRRQYGT